MSQNLKSFIIVAYYTKDTPYEAVANQYLLPSLKKLDIDYDVQAVPNFGGWRRNTNYKPIFARLMLEKHKRSIVLVDVDAEILEYPKLFDEIPLDFDIAAHYLDWFTWYQNGIQKKEFLSGTLLLRNKLGVKSLIEDWKLRCEQKPMWEQILLGQAVESSDIKVYSLPLEYCYIDSLPNGRPPHIKVSHPIIIHHQVSRKLKKVVGV